MTLSIHIDREELMAWLDDEVAPVRALEIESHVGGCAACRTEVEAQRAVSARLAAWTIAPAPAAFTIPGAPRGFWSRVVTWRHWTWRQWLVPIGAAATIVVGVGTLRRAAPGASVGELAYRQEMAAEGRVVAGRLTSGQMLESRPPETVQPDAPLVVKTARIQLTIDAFDHVRDAIEAIARDAEGAVADLTVGGSLPHQRTLSATLWVPAARLDATLQRLRGLGEVGNESQASEDITASHRDLAIRIANARIEEQRLGELLTRRTGSVKDVLDVEREIARVRTSIEQMSADERAMRDRVAMSAITVQAGERYRAELGGASASLRMRFGNALVEGLRDALDGLIDVAIAALQVGPTVALWCALIAPFVWLFRRRWLARRRTV